MANGTPKSFYAILIAIPMVFGTILVAGYCIYVSHQSKGRADVRIEGDWPIRADHVLGFSASRNASTVRHDAGRGLTYSLYTDNRGARINAPNLQGPDQVDVVTIGGSFSWGVGIPNEATFTQILGRKMNVRVANFAYGSYGTVQSLQLLELNADLKPKVVIYGFITDHIRRNLSPCAPSYSPYCLPVSYVDVDEHGASQIRRPVTEYSSSVGQDYFEFVAEDSLSVSDAYWGARAIISRVKMRYMWNTDNDPRSREISMKDLMSKMVRAVEAIDALLVVVHIPNLNRGRTESAPKELVGALPTGVVFIDLSAAVRDYYADPDRPLLRFERDSHPNDIAHELIAREIHQVLESKEVF